MELLNSDLKRSPYAILASENPTLSLEVTYLTDDSLLIIYRISKGKIDDTENQSELPLASLS